MSTSTRVLVSTCATREQLAREFRVLLDTYNELMLRRMDDVGLEAAFCQLDGQYQRCIKAREALRAHELEHHCYVCPSDTASPGS